MLSESRRKMRTDNRWGHPEAVEQGTYNYPGSNIFSIYSGLEEKTEEELKSAREAYRKPLLDITMENLPVEWNNGGEWKTYYTEHGCPEEADAPPVRLMVRVPNSLKKDELIPVMFCCSGGGLGSAGTPELSIEYSSRLAIMIGKPIVIVTFEYRLAPIQYPAAINDLHAAYIWMLEHAEELKIDTDKIVIWGGSTGGHLALSGAFRLKRYDWCGAPMPRGVIAYTPVMDDVAYTDSFSYSFSDESGGTSWDSLGAQMNFRMWLGDRFGDPELPPEAVPNRATAEDIKGYPPVWFPICSEIDASRDSTYKFAQLLHQAGIFCDIHVWGGGSHQLMTIRGAEYGDLGTRVWDVFAGSVRDAITYDFRRTWLLE